MMRKLVLAAIATAAFAATSVQAAEIRNFRYLDGLTTVATGSFSYADGLTGVLGYGDLDSFEVTVAGVSYDLADVNSVTDYIHFAYDTAANAFLTESNGCGFAGCGYVSSLSAISSGGNFGFFFNPAPGAFLEYTTFMGGNHTEIQISNGAVPEPATWGLMILGFGAAGATLRSRRRTVAA